MSDTTTVQTNVPVSFLSPCDISELSNETLLLISVPNSGTETGYISKNIKFSDIEDFLCSDFKIYKIQNDICFVNDQLSQLDFSKKTFTCDTIQNPYIISSITEASCSITSISGYRLSAGMQQYFLSKTKFDGQLKIGSVELYGDSADTQNRSYIDFHYNNDITRDYTSRIIEETSGTIEIISNLHVPGNLTVDNDVIICGDINLCGDINIDWNEHIQNNPVSSEASSEITIAPSYNAVYIYGQNILREASSHVNIQEYTLPYATSSILGGVYLWSGTLEQYNKLVDSNQINSHALYFVHE